MRRFLPCSCCGRCYWCRAAQLTLLLTKFGLVPKARPAPTPPPPRPNYLARKGSGVPGPAPKPAATGCPAPEQTHLDHLIERPATVRTPQPVLPTVGVP